jgi:FKBP-type peptidyl-prolyl cis-trans isomerase 2
LNHALDDVEKLLGELLKTKEGGATTEEAVRAYKDEVVQRGSKAVLASLEDALANMKVGIDQNRLATQGVVR